MESYNTLAKKEFIKFLKEKNALIPFCTNLAKFRNLSLDKHLNRAGKDLEVLIAGAFFFALTKEGHEYWTHISCDWIETFLKNRRLNNE